MWPSASLWSPSLPSSSNSADPSSALGPMKKILTKFLATSVDDRNVTPSPDWRRLTVLLLWYLAGIPVAWVMRGPCIAEAPETWGRAIRVFIEGVVAFGLAGCIYVSNLLLLTSLMKLTAFFVALGLSGF